MTYTNGNANGNGHAATPTPAATRLRKMLTESDELIVMPGVYDGFSARIALEVGFDGLYMVSIPPVVPNYGHDLCPPMMLMLLHLDGRRNMCFKAWTARLGLCLAQ